MKNRPFLRDFAEFLKEYKVISLAIAFIVGEASTSLVNSLVTDIFLPIFTPLMSAESWKAAAFSVGAVTISYGAFLADFVNFIVVALLVFVVVKKIMKLENEVKK